MQIDSSASGRRPSGHRHDLIRRFVAASASLVTLTSAACGGGEGNSAPPVVMPSPTPAPSPTPTPAPTPSPTPSASYRTFDELTGSREFLSGCGNLFGTGNTSSEWMGSYPGNPEALAHKYDEPSDSWHIAGFARDDANGPEYAYVFDQSDLDPASTEAAIRYGFIDNKGSPVVFSIVAPTLGSGTARYVRGTRLIASPGINKIDIHCVIGVTTEESDSLPTGNFAYASFAIAGTAVSGTTAYDLRESTATWSGSGSSLQFKTQLNLVGRAITPTGLSETRVNLGTYSTDFGWLNPPSKFFGGALFNSDGGNSGTFGGSLFGPQGVEIAYGFAGGGSASGMNFQFAGTMIGRR